ncbi:MAG: hypothetical protein ABI321_07775 [Polyangia bacterium]
MNVLRPLRFYLGMAVGLLVPWMASQMSMGGSHVVARGLFEWTAYGLCATGLVWFGASRWVALPVVTGEVCLLALWLCWPAAVHDRAAFATPGISAVRVETGALILLVSVIVANASAWLTHRRLARGTAVGPRTPEGVL